MIFEIFIPSFPLNNFVESFIYFRDVSPVHDFERFFPDGNVNLVIDLTETPKFIYDNYTLKEIQSCTKCWFSGMRNKSITIPSGKGGEMFVVNFHKGKAYPFVSPKMDALADLVVDAEQVMGNAILELRSMLLDLTSPVQKFRVAEAFLARTYGSKFKKNPVIEYAVSSIVCSPQDINLFELSTSTGYSQKHFIQMFREHVGLTPKGFLRIMRFQKIITELSVNRSPDWSAIALEAGYFDQAHFNHDFKNFSGFSPTNYLSLQSEYLNYVAIR